MRPSVPRVLLSFPREWLRRVFVFPGWVLISFHSFALDGAFWIQIGIVGEEGGAGDIYGEGRERVHTTLTSC